MYTWLLSYNFVYKKHNIRFEGFVHECTWLSLWIKKNVNNFMNSMFEFWRLTLKRHIYAELGWPLFT